MVKLKKYFYVLRPILACRWILDRQTPPPVLFSELSETYLDKSLVPIVDELVRIKTETPEIGTGPRIDALNDYLEASIEEVDAIIKTLPEDEPISWEELNALFLRILKNTN